MSQAEKLILEKWIASRNHSGHHEIEPSVPKYATGNYVVDNSVCFRVDCLVHLDDQILIVEVKKKLDQRQLGQLLSFNYLYKEGTGHENTLMIAVIEESEPALVPVFIHYGIRIDVV